MKKIISMLLCGLLAFAMPVSLVGCGCASREDVLKLYMPGEYIDEEIFEEFESWYFDETGKEITVELETFDAVENIQLAVEASKSDYDLLCPSDYMVEYLIKKDLVQKVDKDIIDVSAEGFIEKAYIDSTKEFDSTLEYAVPYMYGTLGLVYDYSKTNKKIDSWEALFGNEFAGKNTRSLKDSIRDAYAAACLYNARGETANLTGDALKAKIQSIFEDTSATTIENAKTTLKNLVDGGAVLDVDNIKFDMAAKKSDVKVALMWSCDAGYVMNNYEDANGTEHEGNRDLWYVVPKEGGNVYIDCFVINTYAVNVEAANYFLKFLCQKDNLYKSPP